ncbi:MAG: hypothetical protein QOG23_1883 [Blastocatellia bacterium]|jgi:hypothetical protein|nr:hypothetical protein [Blastocatellia bacterium]
MRVPRIGSLFIGIFCFIGAQAQQPNIDALRYRYIGPIGNRVTSVGAWAQVSSLDRDPRNHTKEHQRLLFRGIGVI